MTENPKRKCLKKGPAGKGRGEGKICKGILIFMGILIFSLPDLMTAVQKYRAAQEIEAFEEWTGSGWEMEDSELADRQTEETASEEGEASSAEKDESGTSDENSLADAGNLLNVNSDTLIGYIEIPAMDVKLPVYYGATSRHLARGTAVLEGTSWPPAANGEAANCVIAGHRGYQGIPYFREIEKLQVGDPVYLTTVQGTYIYRAESIRIISPEDTGAIQVQEGREMLTLLTCHPYRSHGKYRYLVYCILEDEIPKEGVSETGNQEAGSREEDSREKENQENPAREEGNQEDSGREMDDTSSEELRSSEEFQSSEQEIAGEQTFRKAGAVFLVWMIIFTIWKQNRSR